MWGVCSGEKVGSSVARFSCLAEGVLAGALLMFSTNQRCKNWEMPAKPKPQEKAAFGRSLRGQSGGMIRLECHKARAPMRRYKPPTLSALISCYILFLGLFTSVSNSKSFSFALNSDLILLQWEAQSDWRQLKTRNLPYSA